MNSESQGNLCAFMYSVKRSSELESPRGVFKENFWSLRLETERHVPNARSDDFTLRRQPWRHWRSLRLEARLCCSAAEAHYHACRGCAL